MKYVVNFGHEVSQQEVDDAFMAYTFSNREFFFQLNTGQFNSSFAGADHKIQRAWIQGLTGCGVTVAVVDDGNETPTPIIRVSLRGWQGMVPAILCRP